LGAALAVPHASTTAAANENSCTGRIRFLLRAPAGPARMSHGIIDNEHLHCQGDGGPATNGPDREICDPCYATTVTRSLTTRTSNHPDTDAQRTLRAIVRR